MAKKEKTKTCDICGGTGQVSYFKGVSRFLLSTEECSECVGTGYELDSLGENEGGHIGKKGKPKKKK